LTKRREKELGEWSEKQEGFGLEVKEMTKVELEYLNKNSRIFE
jgi:hypothetical protein